MPTIQKAFTDADFMACADVILYLRPHLKKEALLAQIKEMQQEDYQIIFIAADDDPGKAAAFAGFRHMNKLVSGKVIYIDDLACLPAYQSRGYAGMLLDHVKTQAKAEGLSRVQLDSGHDRHPAHRVYLRKGYYISAHHFTQPL